MTPHECSREIQIRRHLFVDDLLTLGGINSGRGLGGGGFSIQRVLCPYWTPIDSNQTCTLVPGRITLGIYHFLTDIFFSPSSFLSAFLKI